VRVSRREALARLTLTALSLTFLAGCQRDTRPTTLVGVVIAMQPASVLQIASFTLRTDDGQLIELACEGDVGITPSHMRDHMVLAEPVSVPVRYEGDRVIAVRVDDAPTPTPQG
jgi:hypothetical protein